MREFNGSFTFYQIQIKSGKEWVLVNLDHFGYPEKKNKYSFNASGDCWQRCGFHGTFHYDFGLDALRQISRKWKSEKFRLVKRTITQMIEPMAMIKGA